jgi:ubiquinone biosynthesis protein
MSFIDVKEIIEEEYGNIDDVFEYIDEKCLGSASIAQVHKAKLKGGEEVVIKVQRNNIYETMSTDVKLLKKAISILHLNSIIKIMDLNEAIDEMFSLAKEEMNFEIEASHLEEFRENNKDIKYVESPYVYSNLVTKRTLVMEYVEGIKLDNIDKLVKYGYDLEEIGLKLANNYIKQAIDDGFYHADPHPDNIVIRDGKIVFLDLGMMGRLSNKNKSLLKECMSAIVKSDIYNIERILLNMSTTYGDVDHVKLRADIEKILNKCASVDIKEIDIIEFINSMFNMLKENKIKLNKNITMLIRGICVMEGSLEIIAPNISLFTVLSNKIKEESIEQIISKDAFIKAGKNIINAGSTLPKIPNEFLNLITDINRGETKFDIEMSNSDKQIDKLEVMLHQVIIGILDAALLLGATLVSNTVLRNIYIGIAIILTIWLIIQMIIDKIHKGL